MNVHDLALKAAVLKALLDEVAGGVKTAKDETEAAFKETGSTGAVPKLPDGTKIASVTLAGGDSTSAYVASPNEFLAWVLKEHPDQTEIVVRPGYQEALLKAAGKAGAPVIPSTGEMIPGVAVKKSTPYVSVYFKPGGKDAAAAAWRAGKLSGLEIPGPVGPAQIEAHPEAA